MRKLQRRVSEANSVTLLSRLFFLVGQTAIKLLVYSEQLVSRIKRMKAAKGVKPRETNNEEEDMVGASAEEDTEDLLLKRISELELVNDPAALLGAHAPALVKVSTAKKKPAR